jgi:hypothetical protein
MKCTHETSPGTPAEVADDSAWAAWFGKLGGPSNMIGPKPAPARIAATSQECFGLVRREVGKSAGSGKGEDAPGW